MRILVIGGTRFIGAAVVRELFDAGHELVLFHRGETETEQPAAIRHMHGERAGIDQHAAAFRAFAPEIVLDTSCMNDDDAQTATAAVRGTARRTVVLSSVDVYRAYGRLHGSEPGPLEPQPLSEASPLRERLHPYGGAGDPAMDDYDKIPVERTYLGDPDMPGTVIRLPAVHGEHDYQRRLFLEVRRFEARRPRIIVPAAAVDWIWPRAYVDNVAHAIALAVTDDRAAGRIYNAPVDPPLAYGQWLAACAAIAGWEGEIVPLPDERLPAHLRSANNYAQSMTIDDSRIRGELGYEELVPAEEGIRRAIAWEASRPVRDIARLEADFAAEDQALAGR